MSAETLRKAAARMRKRAQAASRSPWSVQIGEEMAYGADVICWYDDGEPDYDGTAVAAAMSHAGACTQEDAEHIASWHPNVAFAVADTWDALADLADWIAERNGTPPTITLPVHRATEAARAYLDEEAPS